MRDESVFLTPLTKTRDLVARESRYHDVDLELVSALPDDVVRVSQDREHGFHRIVSTDFAGS